MTTEDEKKQPTPPADQRKALRTPLLACRINFPGERKTFFGYAKNISRSGMFIATTNPREPGSRFTLELPLPQPIEQTLSCVCEVIWKRDFSKDSPYEPGMGLRFIDPPAELAERIAEWVQNQD